MKESLSIAVSVLYPVLQTAKQLELDENQLLEDCAIDPAILSSSESRFTLAQYDCLVRRAVELSGNQFFGLRLGQTFNIGSGNIVSYMILNCSNLQEAILKYIEYQKVVGEAIHFHLSEGEANAVLSFELAGGDISDNRHILEAEAVALYKIGGEMIIPDFKLEEVHFSSPQPKDIKEYQNIFPCLLKWSAPVSAIVFDKEFLKAPLKQPNRELLEMLESQAKSALRRVSNLKSFSDKTVQIIYELGFQDKLGIEEVAARIPASVRTLQLKLKEEGKTFQQLLDEVRKEIAASLLKANSASISEVAYMLGFSEPSAFQKAFKKWTGFTPGEFRKQGK